MRILLPSSCWTLISLTALLCSGCKPSAALSVSRALAATNGFCVPHGQPMIALSNPQLVELKRIIRKFENKADVRVKRESPPTLMATFVVADQQFYWLASYLMLRSLGKTGKWYVVEDPVLAKLGKAYFDAESTVRPSREAIVEMLKILEEGAAGGAARLDVTAESTSPKAEESPKE